MYEILSMSLTKAFQIIKIKIEIVSRESHAANKPWGEMRNANNNNTLTVYNKVDLSSGHPSRVLSHARVVSRIVQDGLLYVQRPGLLHLVVVMHVEEVNVSPVLRPRDDGGRVADVLAVECHLVTYQDRHRTLALADDAWRNYV